MSHNWAEVGRPSHRSRELRIVIDVPALQSLLMGLTGSAGHRAGGYLLLISGPRDLPFHITR
jgi:hypothetical protein